MKKAIFSIIFLFFAIISANAENFFEASINDLLMVSPMKKKTKTFKNFIKDIVFNNPRADRQAGSWDGEDDEWVDNHMLYDTKVKKKN